jgi:uncharacterized protein YkwD
MLAALSLASVLPATAGAKARAHHHCGNAATPAIGASRPAIKLAVVCLINQQRHAHGLPALKEDKRLDRAAQGWSNTMVATKDFSHGSDFAVRISGVGLTWSAAGENIATGFTTPRAVVDAWMGSTGHCANILAPNFSRVGTGVVTRGVAYGRRFATWAQDFALPMDKRAPSHNSRPADGCPYKV